MALIHHLAELERRHQALEQELETVLARPGGEAAHSVAVGELKRRKLKLRDAIEKLRSATRH